MSDQFLTNFNLDALEYVNSALEDLASKELSTKKDIINFFIEVNKITSKLGIYNDVMLSSNEVLQLIKEYQENAKYPFEIEYDLPLFFQNNESATSIVMYTLKEADSNTRFISKVENEEEEEYSGDLVLTCNITVKSKDSFTIKPDIFFLSYELSDDEAKTIEEKIDQEVTDDDLEAALDDEADNVSDVIDNEEEYDEELANDEVVKDLMSNIIISKIYAEGYDYPNEETIEQMSQKLVDMINDFIQNELTIYSSEEEKEPENEEKEPENEEEEPENEEEPVKDNKSEITINKKTNIEMFEKQCFVITAKNSSMGLTRSMVFFENSLEDAKNQFYEAILEMYPNTSWEIVDTLILESYELFNRLDEEE